MRVLIFLLFLAAVAAIITCLVVTARRRGRALARWKYQRRTTPQNGVVTVWLTLETPRGRVLDRALVQRFAPGAPDHMILDAQAEAMTRAGDLNAEIDMTKGGADT